MNPCFMDSFLMLWGHVLMPFCETTAKALSHPGKPVIIKYEAVRLCFLLISPGAAPPPRLFISYRFLKELST